MTFDVMCAFPGHMGGKILDVRFEKPFLSAKDTKIDDGLWVIRVFFGLSRDQI